MNKKCAFLFLASAGTVMVAPAGTNTVWISVPSGGAWEDAANWSEGVPFGTNVLSANLVTPGLAYLTNASASYVVNYNVSTNGLNRLTLGNDGSFTTTLNVNADRLATFCINETSPLGQLIIDKNSIVNVNSNGVVDLGTGIGFRLGTLNVNAGGLLTWGMLAANQGITINSSSVNIYGAMLAASGRWAGNQYVQIENGGGTSKMTIDGGTGFWDGTEVGRRGMGTLNITNSASLTIRNGDLVVGQGRSVDFSAVVNVSSGVVTNRSALYIARPPDTSAKKGTGILNLFGAGRFFQFGVAVVGEARNGVISVGDDALFVTTNAVFVGGTNAPTLAAGVSASGLLKLTGGNFVATNAWGSSGVTIGGGAITGTVIVTGGTLIVDRLVATNAGRSVVAFADGLLRTQAAVVGNGVPFVAGSGTHAAVLALLNGTHTFSDGLVINTNAVFAIGGTNAVCASTIVGDVVLLSGSVWDCDFDEKTNDWAQIAGTLTLPESVSLMARALDGSFPKTIPLVEATTINGSVSAWAPVWVNGWKYRAVVDNHRLELVRNQVGTTISLH